MAKRSPSSLICDPASDKALCVKFGLWGEGRIPGIRPVSASNGHGPKRVRFLGSYRLRHQAQSSKQEEAESSEPTRVIPRQKTGDSPRCAYHGLCAVARNLEAGTGLRSLRPAARGRLGVDLHRRWVDHHAVVFFGHGKGDEIVQHVVQHPLRVALKRIAVAAAVGRLDL